MPDVGSKSEWPVSERAAALHADALVCDMTVNWEDDIEAERRRAVLPRYVASGVDFVSITLVDDWSWIEATMRHVAAQRAYFLSRSEDYVLVETAEDIVRAKREGKLGVGFNFQGSNGLGGDLNLVEAYYKLGVRQMILAYNVRNLAADGCHEAADGGLSQYGIDLVREMNRVGMVLDCSHTGYRGDDAGDGGFTGAGGVLALERSCVEGARPQYQGRSDQGVRRDRRAGRGDRDRHLPGR